MKLMWCHGNYRTPAPIPRLSNFRYALAKPALNMREALHRERDTVIGVAVMLIAFLAKEGVDLASTHTGR